MLNCHVCVFLLCVPFSKVWFSNVFVFGLGIFVLIQAIDHIQEMLLLVVMFGHGIESDRQMEFSLLYGKIVHLHRKRDQIRKVLKALTITLFIHCP